MSPPHLGGCVTLFYFTFRAIHILIFVVTQNLPGHLIFPSTKRARKNSHNGYQFTTKGCYSERARRLFPQLGRPSDGVYELQKSVGSLGGCDE
jgi:hypothetical protein